MTIPNRVQPQDRRPTAQEMFHSALSLQAANLLQKAQLDMMATKIIMVLRVERGIWNDVPKRLTGVAADLGSAMGEIGRILSMTREETASARASFEYPDVRIQAVINKATEDIAAILLEDGRV